MSILIDETTRVIVFGLTGATARVDAERAVRYGTRVVAGVVAGRGGESVAGIPVFDTARGAVAARPADVAVIYVPPASVRDAVLEALDAGFKLLMVTTEYVPAHDVAHMLSACRKAEARLIGCNTNGVISPGKCRLGGIGGIDPGEVYVPGRIGICSRSGGMSAEIALMLKGAGFGVSTCVSMGGDEVTGLSMGDYVLMFEDDAETDAVVLFGEPGTSNESDVARLVASGRVRKPVIALVVGRFQENYPAGVSFGHAAALIASPADSASAKRALLSQSGVQVCTVLEDVPGELRRLLKKD